MKVNGIVSVFLLTRYSLYGISLLDEFKKKVVQPIEKKVVKPIVQDTTVFKKIGEEVEKGAKKVGKKVQQVKKEVGSTVQKGVEFVKEQFETLDKWVLPDDRLRLDQVAYLGSHNAHANLQEGFVYNQQLWSFPKQLEHGIRHFLIDIWIGKKGKNKGKLLLCHGECETQSLASRSGIPHHLFTHYLRIIKDFLDKHPKEIITFELENYANTDQILKDIQSVPGLSNYLFTPAINPVKGQWPTLQWLVNKGKRLIIFDTVTGVEKYGFNTNDYITRNMYGSYDLDKACRLRGEKKPDRTLYQMNYFGTIAVPVPSPDQPIHNSPKQLKKVLKRCQQKGVIPHGKKPNFIVLDHVHRGNAMKWVNELNRQALQSL